MKQFGLIGEGITDQIIIESILTSYFSDPDLIVNPLQPLRDATNDAVALNDGNWHKVLEYCGSTVFEESFLSLDYVVIQIDSDVFISENVPEKYRNILSSADDYETIIQKVRALLIQSIRKEFYDLYQGQIIFAISVHAVECWLLPIYYPTEKSKAAKITGCLDMLNKVLLQKEGFYIDLKNPKYYQKIAKRIIKMNKREFDSYAKLNPSLHVFVSSLAHITA